jgi:Gas vesicle synthesis protein GvpL/GvpF
VESTDLDAVIAALAAALAPGLVAEAREEAIADVRAELAGRLSAELLRRCEAELGIEAPAAPAEPEEPAPISHPLAENARREAIGHYVYGVIRSGVPLPRDLVGVDPAAPVHLLESRGLAALVSEVPLAEFDEESLRRNLNDVAWLEEKARAHEQVLEAALTATAVVPLRLCTVFTGEEQVIEMLGREYGVLLDALERLGGRAEWGVKAFVGGKAIEREVLRRAAQADEEEDDQASAGTAYMNRRRREARAREEAEEIADEWAGEIHARLAAIAGEALLNPLQRSEVSGHPGEMLLNGVYLVADEEASGFRSAARELAERYDRRGVEIVLTGPWPAYNFVKSSIEAAR